MNIPMHSVAEQEFESRELAPTTTSATRPLYWSIRRELWENRSLYLVPLLAAGVYFLAFVLSTFTLPGRVRAAATFEGNPQVAALVRPYSIAALLIIVVCFLVGASYCLESLQGERRDRSILFWKSLPVSDRVTVLSKASIPLVLLPLFSFAIIVVLQLLMVLWSTGVLLVNGMSPMPLWSVLPLLSMTLVLIYGLIVVALWHAPIYGWLLLVSAWSRRMPVLWAILPLAAIAVIETIAFNTMHFARMLTERFIGSFNAAFTVHAQGNPPHIRLSELDPWKFITTPALWIGLAFAVLFLSTAIRLRRRREPI